MKKIIWALVILMLIAGCAEKIEKAAEENPEQQPSLIQEEAAEEITEQEETKEPEKTEVPSWKEGSAAIAGKYADADIIDLGNGKYRMYYSLEPEVSGFKGQVYSALSSDGINWEQEEGVRKEWATFPSVIKLPDGKYRMYFQNQGVIKSAVSSDGLIWQDEPGTRIDTINSEGVIFENVVAPTVISAGSGYVMVYGGAINEKYSAEKVPNSETHTLMWATSDDGLSFEKKGIAVDSRNSVFKGWLDGPEFVNWDGETRLYFWSYLGIYHVVFSNNAFSEPEFDFTNYQDSAMPFPPNPPGDPTLAKINGKWLMYYGQHEKGIYYATLGQQELSQPKSTEKLSIPSSIENNCIGFKINSPNETFTINLIGGGWAHSHWPFGWGRIEKTPGIYDFKDTDNLVKTAQENNILILAEMRPFADWDQGYDPNCKAKEHDYLCKPKDMQAYKKFLSALVERYDGDGESDMPGLQMPIKYWEILSEPDIKEDPYVIFFVGDEKDYLEVLKESYQTIKQVCPDCSVLHGGAAGVEQEFISFWDNVFGLGGADYFDIANIHFVGIDIATGRTVSLGDPPTLNVKPFKVLLDKYKIKKPIWVTEAVLKSSSAKSSLQGALSAGASKVFFVGFGVEESAPAGEYSADYNEIAGLCPKAS